MNHVIIIRKAGEKNAQGHIGTDGYDRVFCGDSIPLMILDQWDDPRNPYKGKGAVTCRGCLTEFNNGRRFGYRGESSVLDANADQPEISENGENQ